MAKSYNDLMSRGFLKYNGTASANDILSGSGARIFQIRLIPAAAKATLLLADAATVTGADLIHLQAPADGASDTVDFGPNGHVFDTGISTTLAGVGALYEIYYMEA